VHTNITKHLLPPPSHTLLSTIIHVIQFIRFWYRNHCCRCCLIVCNTLRQTRVSVTSVCNILLFRIIKGWYGLIFFQALLASLLSPTSTIFNHTAIRTFRLILLFDVNLKLLCSSFSYWQSLPEICYQQTVINNAVSSSDRWVVNYPWIPSSVLNCDQSDYDFSQQR